VRAISLLYTSDMALDRYRDKRKFEITPEPSGLNDSKSREQHFVVQEHFASHHHFDFRLELPADFLTADNPSEPIVLKSWAIPKGSYGAGTVSIWDEGTFEIVHKKPGSLKFTLHGKKLSGDFHLVHTKRGKGNEWLIFK
jgi:bifunctional non-homologous end joining protein LigD